MSSRRVALVTGGASGIGLGISEALTADEFDLVVCGRRDETSVYDALDRLRSAGSEVLYVPADIGSLDDHRRLLDAIEDRFGRLDVLVNNAGVAPTTRMDILETTPESYDRVMGINLRGPFFLTQAVANWMVRQAGESETFLGSIINITSISSTIASPNRGEYCISKAGLTMMSSLWAVRLAEYGIPVFEVRPGIIRSDMTSAVEAKYDRLIENGLMLQARWGEPDDVGKAVAMLARGDLRYSTGQVVMVDGGLTVGRL
jgi:3-oxoacyl-[acyl-carrier protein] reductase